MSFAFAVLTFLAWGGYPYIELVEVSTFAGAVNTVVNFIPWIPDWLYKLRFVVSALLVLLLAGPLFKHVLREKVLLIKHHSFANQLAGYNMRLFQPYKLTNVDIKLDDKIFNIEKALRYQDDEMKKILQQPFAHYFYYGIAHTPFVFCAGFLFGDECNVRLLHKKRTNDSVFDELKNMDNENLSITRSEHAPSVSSDELLLVICTSLEITDDDMLCFNPDSKHLLKFELASKSFDNISSYQQMERYRNEIYHQMREKCKNYSIKTVHIVAATSVAFTFFLGQGISETHDPDIIIYHYENSTYPWGLRVKVNAERSLVRVCD